MTHRGLFKANLLINALLPRDLFFLAAVSLGTLEADSAVRTFLRKSICQVIVQSKPMKVTTNQHEPSTEGLKGSSKVRQSFKRRFVHLLYSIISTASFCAPQTSN